MIVAAGQPTLCNKEGQAGGQRSMYKRKEEKGKTLFASSVLPGKGL